MKAMTALLVGIVSLHACIDPDDLASAELQQAEIIEVHGCRPGHWDIGDGICVDPWPGGGGGPTGGEGGPGDPGPSPGGGPGPKPDRKQCGPEMGVQGCLDCCMYNHIHVDGWECDRIRNKKAKRLCREKAIEDLSVCQVTTCNRHEPDPIITTAVP